VTGRALIVGYGNALRMDDGVGWHAAERLADDPRMGGAVVLRRQQLTPEIALDVSRASVAVLIDARHGPPAGTVTVERVERSGDGTTWSHHLGPGTLVALAEELYGRAPAVFVVSVGVESLEIGEQLSAAVEAALAAVVDAVVAIVDGQAVEPWADPVSEHGRA
jgi:hydrogenase maturation protease